MNSKRDRWIRLQPALILLRDAHHYAMRTGKDVWQFATELEELQSQGLTTTDLRWLISTGIVLHGIELSTFRDPYRKFEKCDNLFFSTRSCFVLSEKGLISLETTSQFQQKNPEDSFNGELRSEIDNKAERKLSDGQSSDSKPDGGESIVPEWDHEKRVLMFQGEVVKRFKWPAVNQELVVNAFHEQGWPEMIHDPIPPIGDVKPKNRLHDTIKCLNRNRVSKSIKFHGNGDGTGVLWKREPAPEECSE
ncbi:MAG: hypothetical protein AAF939_03815 [Planctomycetota bacterium]